MSRQLISRSDQVYYGRATFGPYQADKPGQQVHLTYRWRPTNPKLAITWSAALAAGAVAGVLASAWAGPAGLYPITFSDSEVLTGLFTPASTAVKFYPATAPMVGGGYGVASATGVLPANTAQAALVNAVTTAATVAGTPPAVGVANSIALTQSIAAAGSGLINGALASGGVATLDVPRNIVAAWTGTGVVTITGTDYYGQTQTWVSASGTATTSTKTFATITAVTSSAAITAFTMGTGNVLGLPFRVSSGDISPAMFNDAADAGTFVIPDLTLPATSTSGDVRGTYTPAGTLNGAKFLSMLLKVTDPSTQVGAFGVTPA